MSNTDPRRTVTTGFRTALILGVVVLAVAAPVPLGASDETLSSEFAKFEVEAGRIRTAAEEAGALGAYWDATAGQLVVVLAKDRSIDGQALDSATVATRVAKTSLGSDQFERAKSEVVALVEAGRLHGESTEVALNLEAGTIEIRSTAKADVFASIFDELGSAAVFLTGYGPFNRLISRGNDSPPYKGGGVIKSGGFPCSSGFAVKLGSAARMLTAGHCFSLGATVTDGAGAAFGTVTARAVYPARDTELIGGQSYAGRIFTGVGSLGVTNPVNQASDPIVGIDYCSNGAVGLELCGLHATAIHLLACDPDGLCTDKMVRFSNDNPFQEGDSGGPIFIYSGPNVQARGTIIGEWSGNSYGQEWTSIAAAHGVTICTTNPC